MRFFHGAGKTGPYFEGWYFRHLSQDGEALALIPAFHIDEAGRASASLQVIAPEGTWTVDFPGEALQASEGVFQIWLDGNLFNRKGMWLDLKAPGLDLRGEVRYGPFTRLKSDIMGPFRLVPGLECSHGVISMGHRLEGTLILNGRTIDCSGGTGYIETDRGRSFPSAYLWTQCAWKEARSSGLMLSVAEVPLLGGRFTGSVCAVLYGGREYRLATYRGLKVQRWSPEGVLLRQGPYRLAADLLEGAGQPLRAPAGGRMTRTIRESVRATVRYRFWAGEELIFDHTDGRAAFEYDGGGEADQGRAVR